MVDLCAALGSWSQVCAIVKWLVDCCFKWKKQEAIINNYVFMLMKLLFLYDILLLLHSTL